MAGLNKLKTRIESVRSTQKITRAMYLISASRSRKAKRQLDNAVAYFRSINLTLAEILAASRGLETEYLKSGPGEGKPLYIFLGGDKGMAGGYNSNLIRLMDGHADRDRAEVWAAGIAGRAEVIRHGYSVNKDFRYPVMEPTVYRAREISEAVVEGYLTHVYSEVYIVYTTMESQLKQTPVIAPLLPLDPQKLLERGDDVEPMSAMMYEPGPREVFDHLVPFYIKGVLYGAFVDAFTCEQQARMYAMDNASKSADDMIAGLSLRYNRARQAIITQEINEIVGGIPTE